MPPVNRLAPQPANSFAEYGPYGPVTSDPAASAAYQQQLVSGLGSGLANQLRGMYQTVRHAATSRPVDDIRGALASLAALYDDPMQALQALREMRQRAMSGPQGLGQVLGELAPLPGPRGAPTVKRDIFVGPNSKTWDITAAKQAEKLEAAKESPEQIWRQTGTFRGLDGKWRQEVSDANAVFTNTLRAGQIKDVLRHPELQAAYPDLSEINVRQLRVNKDAQGEYVSPTQNRAERILYANDADRGVVLHELQHAVQKREGFSEGGAPFTERQYPETYNKELILLKTFDDKMYDYKQMRKSLPLSERPSLNATVNWWAPDFDADNLIDEIESKVTDPTTKKQMLNFAFDLAEKRDELFGWEIVDKSKKQAYANYLRLAGEAEARAVQSRAKMTPAERRDVFPLHSYDVPISEIRDR